MHAELVAFVRGEDPAWPAARGEAGDSARVYDDEPSVLAGRYDDVLPLLAEARR
ncbi:hypothetical protein Q0F99_08595 [Rathayibacter oskolensis]|uniref:hypothetical protein n=1 Tax=Rathayibacter oskolensis TaxID=1891671 RepID=UPI00265EE01E|nr:hypothetical protein [Rathayibacter oskolensis]WKK72914.1 hypothetical protein Q0F99_08595 [Rathayibacter oskolensis]